MKNIPKDQIPQTNLEVPKDFSESLPNKLKSIKLIKSIFFDNKSPMPRISLLTNAHITNKTLIAISSNDIITIRNSKTPFQKLKAIKVGNGHIYSIKLLDDSKIVVTSHGNDIQIFNIYTGKCILNLIGHVDNVFTFISLKNTIFLSGGYDNKIIKWKITKNMENTSRKVVSNRAKQSCCYYIEQLSDNQIVATSNQDLHIYSFHPVKIDDFQIIRTLRGHRDRVKTIKKINENLIASGSFDKTINLWNLKCPLGINPLIKTLEGHTNYIVANILAIEKNFLLTCSVEIKIWRIANDIGSSDELLLNTIEIGEELISGVSQVDKNMIWIVGNHEKIKLLKW